MKRYEHRMVVGRGDAIGEDEVYDRRIIELQDQGFRLVHVLGSMGVLSYFFVRELDEDEG